MIASSGGSAASHRCGVDILPAMGSAPSPESLWAADSERASAITSWPDRSSSRTTALLAAVDASLRSVPVRYNAITRRAEQLSSSHFHAPVAETGALGEVRFVRGRQCRHGLAVP